MRKVKKSDPHHVLFSFHFKTIFAYKSFCPEYFRAEILAKKKSNSCCSFLRRFYLAFNTSTNNVITV